MAQPIEFRFDEERAAAAAAHFLKKRESGRMSYMRLIKLLYLADRLMLHRHNRVICGDRYVSMKHGPVVSRTFDLIKGGVAAAEGHWESAVTIEGYHAELAADPGDDCLSNAEVAILDEVYDVAEKFSKWQLRDRLHMALPEYEETDSAIPITVERLLEALEKSPEEVEEVRRHAEEGKLFRELFAE